MRDVSLIQFSSATKSIAAHDGGGGGRTQRARLPTLNMRPLESWHYPAWLGVCLLVIGLPVQVWSRHVSLVIAHTTDVHGHILSARDYDGTENVGGLLRCATIIEQWREQYPNFLLVDCGDLYQGAIESYLSRGQIMNRALAWMGYDVWVLGNHEFDWGLQSLVTAVERSEIPVLGANVGSRPGRANPLHRVRPYWIRQVDGLRVAFVGLTTDAIPTWFRPDMLGDLIFEDSVQALQRVLPEVRAQRPDLIVLLAHQGYRPFGDSAANQINRIARHFPEIDVIIGGHSHQPIEQAMVNGILYTQAGYFGIWLGKVRLTYDTVQRKLIERSASLTYVDESIAQHPGMREAFHDELVRAEQEAGRVVGRLEEPLSHRSRTLGQSGVQQLLCRAIAAETGADVILHGALAEESLLAGYVYERDLRRIVPYENTIGVLHLTVGEIRDILEENTELIRSSQFLGVHGIQYELHEYAVLGERVRNLRWDDGTAIHPRRRIRVALNSYVVASGGGRFPLVRQLADNPVHRLEMTRRDTRGMVRRYLADGRGSESNGENLVRRYRNPL